MHDNSKPPAPAVDALTQRLRATMLKDRSRFRRHLIILLALVALTAGGVVWWIYRQTSLPPLTVVAFDNLCVPSEEFTVNACVEAIEGEPMPGYLGGLEIVFTDLAGSAPVKARTQGPGQATAQMKWNAFADQAPFLVRLPGNRRMSTSEDRARIVFLARGEKIILVDVHDLPADATIDFATSDLNQIAVDSLRAGKLQMLRKRGHQIVYLALKGERALDYRVARRWIESRQQLLPSGPVLGRPTYHEHQTEDDARRQIISELSSRYEIVSQE